jgi:hypothetical protein
MKESDIRSPVKFRNVNSPVLGPQFHSIGLNMRGTRTLLIIPMML